jgi:hypothetical protein
MIVTELNTTTPYDNVVAIVSSAIQKEDFNIEVDASGVPTFMNIYDDLGDALRIEMDCLLFTDVYTSLTDDVRAQQDTLLGPLLKAIS